MPRGWDCTPAKSKLQDVDATVEVHQLNDGSRRVCDAGLVDQPVILGEEDCTLRR